MGHEKYERLIQKLAWRYAKMYQEDVEDLIQEGWVVYMNAQQTWNPEKGAFSTHLYHRLRTLGDYCKKHKGTPISADDFAFSSVDMAYRLTEFYDQARQSLSKEGQEALEYILSEKWRTKRITPGKFGKATLQKGLGWTAAQVSRVWEELTAFTATAVPA